MNLRFSENGFVHLCGHRGHSEGAPENTIAALAAAKQLGATACEIDIMLTRDGEIVLMHDYLVNRTTDGTGAVEALSAAEIAGLDAGSWFAPRFAGEKVPTFRDALLYAKSVGLGLVVEIKERRNVAGLVDKLVPLLRETGTRDDVIVISFDHHPLRDLKARHPDIRTEVITHARHVDMVAVVQSAHADSVSIELDMFHPDDARALHKAGLALRLSLPPPAALEHLARHGLDIEPAMGEWIAAGLVDFLSGNDVAYMARLRDRYAPSTRARTGDRAAPAA